MKTLIKHTKLFFTQSCLFFIYRGKIELDGKVKELTDNLEALINKRNSLICKNNLKTSSVNKY